MNEATFSVTEYRRSEDRPYYGLKIERPDNETWIFCAVSTYREDVERLCRRMQGADISSCHYEDIVYDYMVEMMLI
ncbi:MAG: hypothetical protein IJK02_02770 [Clostridia bacterium]|nr:hypothetical protein [Clostridia bacterium]